MGFEIEEPIVIPQKTFDKWWVRNMIINSTPAKTILSVNFIPFNSTTGETSGLGNTTLRIDDLFKEAAKDEELTAIINLMLDKLSRIAKDKEAI